jgi:hypothetical protein
MRSILTETPVEQLSEPVERGVDFEGIETNVTTAIVTTVLK